VSSPPLGTALSWAARKMIKCKSNFAKRNQVVRSATQFLQLEQHCEHAFELSVEMNLIAGKAFEPVRIDGFAKCLSAN